jgi:DNA-binding MarR family transcriptional regulator
MIEEVREYLIECRLQPENIAFICGYLSDKPERWHTIFLLRAMGKTQQEIADEVGLERSSIARIIIKIGEVCKNIHN